MMKADTKTVLTVMTNMVTRKLQAGVAKSADPVRFYGFTAAEVIGLHFWKRHAAESVWFRLRDGRVIDSDGNPSESDLSHYVREYQESMQLADAVGL